MSENKPSSVFDYEVDLDEVERQKSIMDFFSLSEEEQKKFEEEDLEWKKHWVRMPEFEQENNPPYKKIYISFRTEEDYKEFAKVIGQNLTEKTKSIWYPKLEKDDNALKRWMEFE